MTMRDLEQTSDARVVLMVSTYAKVARFVPLIRETLAETWPGHPSLRFLTDGGIEGDDVIVGRQREFVPLMVEGLARIRAEFPAASHVFHMLEDHCPLRRCDEARIKAGMRAGVDHDLAAVAFLTYAWPWNFGSELKEFGKESFLVLPLAYFRYFQVQPTLWRIDYLEKILAASMRLGITDPWNFEALPIPDRPHGGEILPEAEQHYISLYRWPTVHHGFLTQGKIHDQAIDFADRTVVRSLRAALIKDAAGRNSEVAYRSYRAAKWMRRLPARVHNKLKPPGSR